MILTASPPPSALARPPVRLLLLADYAHPYIYREGFPSGLPAPDLVLAAGDVPGYYLEFLATRLTVPVLYVPGNHANEYINEGDGRIPARGVTNLHGRVLEVGGLRLAGWGGVPRYSSAGGLAGQGQYSHLQASWGLWKLRQKLRGRPLDVLLTHAPPTGPHALSDYAHRGCAALSAFMARARPRLLVHGHIHEYEGRRQDYTDPLSGTRVLNAYGYLMVEV